MGNITNVSDITTDLTQNVGLISYAGANTVSNVTSTEFGNIFSQARQNMDKAVPLSDLSKTNPDSPSAKEDMYDAAASSRAGTKIAQSKEDLAVDEKAIDETQNAISSIKEKIEEDLGVSEEEIALAMEAMGITDIDLLDKSVISDLCQNLLGEEDKFSLLMHDEFSQLISDVSEVIDALTKELNMSIEEINALFNAGDLEASYESVPDASFESVLSEAGVSVEAGDLIKDNITQNVMEDASSKQAISEQAASQMVSSESEAVISDEEKLYDFSSNTDTPLTENVQVSYAAEDTKQHSDESYEESPKDFNAFDNAEELPKETVKADDFSLDTADKTLSDEVSPEDFDKVSVTHQNTGVISSDAGNVIENIADTVTETVTYIDEEIQKSIISQITERAFIQLDSTNSTMQMQLEPANLGRILLSVTTKGAEVNAHIITESEMTKAAIENQMSVLKENLSGHGYRVEAVDVTVEEQAFDRNLEERARDEQNRRQSEQEASGKRRNIINGELDSLSGIMTEEEELVAKIMRQNGNTMDVSA